MDKMSTSERVQHMKEVLECKSDVEFGKLSGASKSVVGQWITGKIKEIAPRYAYKLEQETHFLAKWIMLGGGHPTRDASRNDSKGKQQPEPVTYTNHIQWVLNLMLSNDPMDHGYIHRAVEDAIKQLALQAQEEQQQKVAGQTGTQ